MDKPITIEPRQAALKWHVSYLNKVARELRVIAKQESRGLAVFDRGNSWLEEKAAGWAGKDIHGCYTTDKAAVVSEAELRAACEAQLYGRRGE